MLSIFLDIGPLQEREYTGISQVTAKLAEALLGDPEINANFIYADLWVPKKIVEGLVKHRNGSFFRYHFRQGDFNFNKIQYKSIGTMWPSVCLYPNIKTARRRFPVEAQIIHDLSTLFFPEFHSEEVVRSHSLALAEDIASNDVTFCVSKSTQNDVVKYFGVPKERTAVCHLGAPNMMARQNENKDDPYLLIVGTLEPRKNLRLIFSMLRKYPEILSAYKFIFVGRFGWGDEIPVTLQNECMIDAWKSGQLQFIGFVSEEKKMRLIQNASLTIYPSIFEGFGMPVLESLALGTPVVTTFSSSLPEVGGGAAYYCDPFDPTSLFRAIIRALGDIRSKPEVVASACLAQAAQFSWGNFYKTIKSGLGTAYDKKLITKTS